MRLQKFARIVSVLGHPFVLLPLTVLLATLHTMQPERALKISAVTSLVTVFPLLFIIRRKVITGEWSDHDVSVSAERRGFYPIVIGIVVISYLIFWFLGFPDSLLKAMIVSLALLLIAMLINVWSKISLHLIFASYCAVSLLAVRHWVGVVFMLLAILIAWSRVTLERHSLVQALSGMALGSLGGIVLLRLINFW